MKVRFGRWTAAHRRRARRLRLVVFDFDGVFTDNAVYTAEDGREMVRCSRSDGWGLRRLEKLGVRLLVLSTEENPVVGARCRKLKLPYRQGVSDKLSVLREITGEAGLDLAEVAFVGNDINDVECLRAVGFPVAVADAYPEALAAALYHTRRAGGQGAVREFCERVAEAQETKRA